MTDAAEMRFFMPDTIAEATRLLAQRKKYQCLAGGGLVVGSLRGGIRPPGLISLKHVTGLSGIARQTDGSIRIGAMTPHADVARFSQFQGGQVFIGRAAAQIAHPVIRNMATIGGTLCRADPSADYSCALLAAGAAVHLKCKTGERVMMLRDFTIADGRTARRDDELLIAVTVPSDAGQGSGGYVRFSRVDGDYPVATAAARLDWCDGIVSSARVAIGGCGPVAYLVAEAESLLAGASSIDDVPDALMTAAIDAAQPKSDLKGSAAFRRMLIPGLLRRALLQAFVDRPHG